MRWMQIVSTCTRGSDASGSNTGRIWAGAAQMSCERAIAGLQGQCDG